MGASKLVDLNAVHLRDFIDARQKAGADLSFLSTVLRWAQRVRRLDVNEGLAGEARASLGGLDLWNSTKIPIIKCIV